MCQGSETESVKATSLDGSGEPVPETGPEIASGRVVWSGPWTDMAPVKGGCKIRCPLVHRLAHGLGA